MLMIIAGRESHDELQHRVNIHTARVLYLKAPTEIRIIQKQATWQ